MRCNRSFEFLSFAVVFGFTFGGVVEAEEELEMREIFPGRFATGALMLKMQGKEYEFLTTSQVLAGNLGVGIEDSEVKAFAEKMAGKTVDTAVLRLIGGSLYVSLAGSVYADAAGVILEEMAGAGFSVHFELDPKTLELVEDSGGLSYSAPGSKTSDSRDTSSCVFVLESAEKRPDGSLSLKGIFSGTLDTNMLGEALIDPEEVSGSFHIIRATGNDIILPLFEGG